MYVYVGIYVQFNSLIFYMFIFGLTNLLFFLTISLQCSNVFGPTTATKFIGHVTLTSIQFFSLLYNILKDNKESF